MDKRTLTVENVIGETKGTPDRSVKQNFKGETSETGMYLAIARQAEREGYPEIAQVLKSIAWEEAEHAARFAELNGMISDSLFDNIAQMLEGEIFANKDKKEAADKAASWDWKLPGIILMNRPRTKAGMPECWKVY